MAESMNMEKLKLLGQITWGPSGDFRWEQSSSGATGRFRVVFDLAGVQVIKLQSMAKSGLLYWGATGSISAKFRSVHK